MWLLLQRALPALTEQQGALWDGTQPTLARLGFERHSPSLVFPCHALDIPIHHALPCPAGVSDLERALARINAAGAGVGSARDAPHVVLYEDVSKKRVQAS